MQQLNFLFAAVTALNFTVQFYSVNDDYFIFSGDNSVAHLYGNGTKIYYFERNGAVSNQYHCDIDEPEFTFTWPNLINGQLMKPYSDIHELGDINFDAYTFLSPVKLLIPEIQHLCSTCSYPVSIVVANCILLLCSLIFCIPETVNPIKRILYSNDVCCGWLSKSNTGIRRTTHYNVNGHLRSSQSDIV